MTPNGVFLIFRRMQTIYRKARELQEERGIRAGYLATGLARWDELFLEPAAPVLLRALTITPTRARYDDFDLTLDDDVEVNPVLLHKLASVFGASSRSLAPNASPPSSPGPPPTARSRASPSRSARSSARSPTPSCQWSATSRRPATCSPTATLSPRSRATRTRSRQSRPIPAARDGRRRPRERLLHPRRRLIPAQRHRRRARGAQPGDPQARRAPARARRSRT